MDRPLLASLLLALCSGCADSFVCGDKLCDQASQYCERHVMSGSLPTTECKPLPPSGCSDDFCQTCLAPEHFPARSVCFYSAGDDAIRAYSVNIAR